MKQYDLYDDENDQYSESLTKLLEKLGYSEDDIAEYYEKVLN